MQSNNELQNVSAGVNEAPKTRSIGVNTTEDLVCTKCFKQQNEDSNVNGNQGTTYIMDIAGPSGNGYVQYSQQVPVQYVYDSYPQVTSYYQPYSVNTPVEYTYSVSAEQPSYSYPYSAYVPVQQYSDCQYRRPQYSNENYVRSTYQTIDKYTCTTDDNTDIITIKIESENKQFVNSGMGNTSMTTKTTTLEIQGNSGAVYSACPSEPTNYEYMARSNQNVTIPEGNIPTNSQTDLHRENNSCIITNMNQDNVIIEDITDQCA